MSRMHGSQQVFTSSFVLLLYVILLYYYYGRIYLHFFSFMFDSSFCYQFISVSFPFHRLYFYLLLSQGMSSCAFVWCFPCHFSVIFSGILHRSTKLLVLLTSSFLLSLYHFFYLVLSIHLLCLSVITRRHPLICCSRQSTTVCFCFGISWFLLSPTTQFLSLHLSSTPLVVLMFPLLYLLSPRSRLDHRQEELPSV